MVYEFNKIKNLEVCGSIGTNFEYFISLIVDRLPNKGVFGEKSNENHVQQERESAPLILGLQKYRIKKKPSDLTNSLVIVNGPNCFTINSFEQYKDKIHALNDVLAANGTHLVFVRGNDSTEVFNNGSLELSNIKCISNFGFVKLGKFSILCIGGSISFDREWKKANGAQALYDENEGMSYDEEELDSEISKHHIDCIITSSSPSFTTPTISSIESSNWVANDKSLRHDIILERLKMDALYSKLVLNSIKPYIWFYDKFNMRNSDKINEILFYSSRYLDFANVNAIVEEYFSITNITKMGFKKKKAETNSNTEILWEPVETLEANIVNRVHMVGNEAVLDAVERVEDLGHIEF